MMVQKYMTVKCRCCGADTQVRTSNALSECAVCHTPNCKDMEAHRTDEDRFIAAADKATNDYWDSVIEW